MYMLEDGKSIGDLLGKIRWESGTTGTDHPPRTGRSRQRQVGDRDRFGRATPAIPSRLGFVLAHGDHRCIDVRSRLEAGGWIFAGNGKAFVGVKFLEGGYVWDEKRTTATPAKFDKATDKSRVLLHAGDIASHGTFDKFKADVLTSRLNVTPDKVDYQFAPAANHLRVTLYDARAGDRFSLPLINGKPVDLRPATTCQSPYLNGDFESDKISVSVGPIQRTLDFSEQGARQAALAARRQHLGRSAPGRAVGN